MKYYNKIALRYVFSRSALHFISIITKISMLGITVGVAALICVMSIMNGFQSMTIQQIVGFDPHIRISGLEADLLELQQEINDHDEINNTALNKSGRVVAIGKDRLNVFEVTAYKSDSLDYLYGIKYDLNYGQFSFVGTSQFPGIIIGGELADKMKILPGDTITLFSPEIIEKSMLAYSNFKGKKFEVTGIFQTNIKDYDSQLAFTSFEGFKSLYGKKSNTVSLDIKLFDYKKAPEIKEILTKKYARALNKKTTLHFESWIDLNKALYNVMKFEKFASFVVIGLIIIIAIFNILASLSMSVIEKRKDIAGLMAMGATTRDIQKIFRNAGIFIGVISSVAGSILGIALCLAQVKFKLFTVNSGTYFIDAIPVEMDYLDIIITVLFTLILSAISTYFPSQRASTTDIVASFRSE